MIRVSDVRLIRLIALGKKTQHRFPANRKIDTGQLTIPKMAPGKIHKVYQRAPFGYGGNPDSPPLLEIFIESVEPDVLGSLTEADARAEGYATKEAFIAAWDYMYRDKPIHFHLNQFRPIWVASFTLHKRLPAGDRLIKKLEQKLKQEAEAAKKK